jgi:DnaK suppressor protein
VADIIDRAKQLEMDQRQRAIDSQLAQSQETEEPLEEGGVRYCLDCGIDIDPDRLKARPQSVRCVECKTIKEKKDARYA